jgi:hypothetical protein
MTTAEEHKAVCDYVRKNIREFAKMDADGKMSVVVSNDKGIAILLYPQEGDGFRTGGVHTAINSPEGENQFINKYPVNQAFLDLMNVTDGSRNLVYKLTISTLKMGITTERPSKEAFGGGKDEIAEALEEHNIVLTDDECIKEEVSTYHVVDTDDIHRFVTINSYFLHDIGGRNVFEERLRRQFQSVELVSCCAVNPDSEPPMGENARADVIEKINAIASQHPGCDPSPYPWVPEDGSDDELSRIRITCLNFARVGDEIRDDLAQILASVDGVLSVVAIIYCRDGLFAGQVLQDADSRGVVPAEITLPIASAADTSLIPGGHWKTIPPDKLSIDATPDTVDMPIAYLVLRGGGGARLALPIAEGKIAWSGNYELTGRIRALLADIGVLV